MSRKGARPGANQRLGLVDVEVGDGMVYLTIYPPGQRSASLEMSPEAAEGLADGIREGAAVARRPEGESDAAAAAGA